ncbi:MAG: serine hydrolase domain-containing protein [Dehalococcoidia bacterium]|nr:MAG: class A beta-lactamase-related serine hydrolase [Chloroflexota bacterium]|tara:strand:- start:316 stop:1338 length:1023 start_codon:yes stop_codon:yes gene_type:complete
MIAYTDTAVKKLKKEGLIRDISLSVFKKNKKINAFNKYENNNSFYIFSAGKPLIAAVIWKLYDLGKLDFEDNISKFWPDFGKNNKKNIKIKDVLNHTSGVSLSNTLSDEDYTDLNRICRWLENYIPESKPGEKIAYHEVTYGWILGELVERITKKSFQESFIELVKNPLNLSSMKFMTVNNERLPLEIYKHESSNLNTIPTIFKLFALNKIPLISGTCMSKSSDLAMFYNAIINNNTWISKKTKNKILKIYSKGIDHNDNMRNVKLGLGIRFDSEIYFENEIDQPEKSFGHTGLVSCIGWGSIEKNITVSILNNLLLSSELNRYRLNVLSSAIKKDLNTI